MNRSLERKKDFIGSISFLAFILFLIVGGYFLTNYLTSDTEKEKIAKSEINQLKVDEKKELVYFTNEVAISEDPDITYKDVVINLKEADTTNELIKKKMDSIRGSVKKISENQVDRSKDILNEESDIFYALERNYVTYESTKYLSLLITDSEYSCYTGSEIKNQYAYTFSLSNGKQLSNETLLGYKSLSIDDVKEKVRAKLSQDQIDFGEENTIYIDDTVNSIDMDNAALYVNRAGKLCISVIVKTSQESYNDTIELG